MASDSLYKTLGVSRSASADEIRKAYRKLARELHPDVNPGDTEAETKFKEVSAAYDVLSDPDRRKAYDEFGSDSLRGGFDAEKARAYQQWKSSRRRSADPFRGAPGGGAQPGGGFGGFDFADLFGSSWGARGPMKGPDAFATVEMTLRQAISGGEVELHIPDRPNLKVRIPPGADNGSTIRLKGKGLPGHEGGEPGDLVIKCRVLPHPRVRRDGLDLTLAVPVTLAEAYLGAEITVPTFGAPVKLKVPPLSQPGTRLRLRGKGVKRGKKSGDLYVELEVALPDRSDEALAEAIRAFDREHPSDVRAGVRL